MSITIEYMAQVKTAAGVSRDSISATTIHTVSQLLHHCAEMHGEALRKILFDDNGKIRPSLLISVNGKQIFPNDSSKVDDGDDVLVISPMSGG